MRLTRNSAWLAATVALAAAAAAEGEVPVGAVILRNGEILAEAANAPRRLNDPTAHAEMLAIDRKSTRLNSSHRT